MLASAAGAAGSVVGAAGGGAGAAGGAPGSAGAAAAGSDGTPSTGTGMCCDDGDCICRGEPPTALTSDEGTFTVESYAHEAGCIYYPTDAEPPFSAVAISDGFGGAGGCGRTQTDGWGRLYASHGIVAMIINTTGGDQPNQRGTKLTSSIAAFKAENENSSSPLHQKLAGRYGTSGFSMGGGGTSFSTADDATLKSSVAVMPYGPTRDSIEVPTLVICGSSDGIASCASHGNRLYATVGESVPKMRVTVSAGHAGQPSAGGGDSGAAGLAFQKVYLDGDQRWKPLLLMVDSDETNIQ
jgi:dienelactone hydrolase